MTVFLKIQHQNGAGIDREAAVRESFPDFAMLCLQTGLKRTSTRSLLQSLVCEVQEWLPYYRVAVDPRTISVWILSKNGHPRSKIGKSVGGSPKQDLLRGLGTRRTKFALVKSLDSSEFSSEFSDFKTFSSNVKVNPVISWNGHNSFHRIFPLNSQDFATPQISFEFSGFYYTSSSFHIKPLQTNDRKTRPFREILSSGKEQARTGWNNVNIVSYKIRRKSYRLDQSDWEWHNASR